MSGGAPDEPEDHGQYAFRTILADPPWAEHGGGKIKRGADRHYDLIKDPIEIADVMKRSGIWQHTGVADNAHLYLWATDNHLLDALEVIRLLQFRYVRTFVWVKTKDETTRELRAGIGQYARGCHELLLFAVRGSGMDESVMTDAKDIPSALLLPHPSENGKRIHSRKPEEFYDLIECRSKGPYLEMFAREARKGWTSWGNELAIE